MPPFLYLIRHAHALDAADDPERPLSKRGRKQVKALAELLRPRGGFDPAEIWHSPLVRARETAELLAEELALKPKWTVVRDLEPEADPAAVARLVTRASEAVALVGHEPHLSGLASLLVTGSVDPVVFVFKKTTMLALEPAGGERWAVRWQLSPDLFE
jgi:phosphohistidine phosphatase